MADEQVREVQVALEVEQQVEDLALDRDVEGRHRLVGDDQVRAQGERPGDADPLALAAGELVRVAARVLPAQADELERVLHARVAGDPVRQALGEQALADDVGDRHPRVERSERVLEDDLHPATQRAHVVGIDIGELVAVEDDPAVRGRGQLDDGPAEGGLAAAGLTDERERLAAVDLEVDAVDRVDRADLAPQDPAVDREVLLEAVHREQRLAGHVDELDRAVGERLDRDAAGHGRLRARQ